MNDTYGLLLGALCVWRLTHLLHAEDGPWDLLARLRRRATGFWAELLGCFYCLSLWLAAPFALLLGQTAVERLLLWPGLSAAACLLERATRRAPEAPATWWQEDPPEDPENDHVLRPIEHPLSQTSSAPGGAGRP